MKRLRVLLVCLIVALLCWYPSQYVYCSEQSLSGPGQSAGDKNPEGQKQEQEQDSTQHKVLEERSTHTSYDMGLETERAALEKLATHNVHQEQTVNPGEAEVEETRPDAESDTAPVTPPEPEPHPDPQADVDLQTDPQDHEQEVPVSSTPEPVPAQGQVSTDAPAPAEIVGDAPAAPPSLDSTPATSPDEAENTPTSQSAGQTHTGAVASAGDELPVDSFVFAEHSDSQCRVIPPELATCENSPFGRPLFSVDEAGIEDQRTDLSHSSGPEAEVQSTPGHVDQEQQQKQQQRQTLEGGLSDLDQEGNTSQHHTEQQTGDGSIVRETDPSVPSKEDIPTFDEWKKQVMEVEKEKSQSLHTSTSGSPHPAKKVQKNFKNNYASVECGAKILSANSEAKSTSAILMENMDLYMLNPCSNKIWFVIELCEPIQVKQLDIANFELFSSTPKDFLVSISDRYPTNKWVKLGTFHARDERIVQSFPLDEQLYAKYVKMFIKYIKVELLSHFGSEHFCPLSLIRVFGTSMVEEYEEIADSQYPSERLEYLDEDYDYPPGYQPSEDKASKDLLGSATNAILNMVNNIAANVLGGKPELEGGTEAGGNTTTEGDEKKGSTEDTPKPAETPQDSAVLEHTGPEHPETLKDSNVSSDSPTPSPTLPDSGGQEDRQIVTLVEEEEDEEPRQSTVTLMEEEVEEEEEKTEESSRREADRNQWESQTYCPFSSLSSLSLSCMATLPELLHRWCSARLAKERLRSLKRRQLSTQTQTQPNTNTPPLTHTPPLIPAPVPTPLKEDLPLTEKAPEPEAPINSQKEGKVLTEAHATQSNTHTPETHTPELNILLEPSRTSTIPPHSFSDIQSSLTLPTPTHEERLLPPIKDAALDSVPTPPLQAVFIPETQQASSATPTLTVSAPPQPIASETPSTAVVVPPVPKEQPVQPLPTASRPEDLIPPPTELPTPVPLADTDTVKSGTETDSQRHNVQTSQTHGEQGDSLTQTGEPHRVEDSVDEDLLSSNGNGNVHRTATDFYAELQNGGDYNGGAMTGNGMLLNGGTVHGSSQKESVFMRLNNRIKALEMNMSLSSRYLEELSQRYRKQMEEMQRAFNKTIIKLQNTSRIAEEQDQKQTESIQVLQSQLENVTKLMLNLTATVSQLQREVSDRQSYLVVSLVLCLTLGLLLCLQCCRSSSPAPNTSTAALPKSNHYPSPKRCFSSYDDMSLKRRVTCPLVRSKSFHLSSTEEKALQDKVIGQG
ncbi:SUN domain-containing ossification factor isoform X4 [Plectropomus leopardus]|uniref:SUN domain-containing ossification factor isoform X4 n=1 Tax=Plectropomus leopardus TaxID=160734 RepID=UPI001C4BA4C0|nr:SUN domain-containing ossification factor isoform X4 [Plectropomus leopardus]